MYTDEDISTILMIQMLRMAEYTRAEIKDIIESDNLSLVADSIRDRLEEKRKHIDGMIKFVDSIQHVEEKGYDPKPYRA